MYFCNSYRPLFCITCSALLFRPRVSNMSQSLPVAPRKLFMTLPHDKGSPNTTIRCSQYWVVTSERAACLITGLSHSLKIYVQLLRNVLNDVAFRSWQAPWMLFSLLYETSLTNPGLDSYATARQSLQSSANQTKQIFVAIPSSSLQHRDNF